METGANGRHGVLVLWHVMEELKKGRENAMTRLHSMKEQSCHGFLISYGTGLLDFNWVWGPDSAMKIMRGTYKFICLSSANHRCVLWPVDQWVCSIFVALSLYAVFSKCPWIQPTSQRITVENPNLSLIFVIVVNGRDRRKAWQVYNPLSTKIVQGFEM